jgi:hypothetical protein
MLCAGLAVAQHSRQEQSFNNKIGPMAGDITVSLGWPFQGAQMSKVSEGLPRFLADIVTASIPTGGAYRPGSARQNLVWPPSDSSGNNS